jgi:hypothetical protein
MSNFGLSLYLLVLNVLIVLTSENVTDAVLNSVAIFFIAEVDEFVVPGYAGDETQDNMFAVELFRHYCYFSKEENVDFEEVKRELTLVKVN